jgi:diguanylate cyclase (GGDEF)-like protein
VNLAYPVGDLLLLTLVAGGTTLLSGRSKGPWLLLGFGMAINVAGDTFNLFGATIGSSHAGTVVNSIAWPTAIWLMSMSMWLPRHHSDPLAVEQPTGFLLPGLASACGMVVLLAGAVQAVNGVAIGLAAATLALVCLRTAISVRALRTLTEERQRLSITDQLTGLGNRRHLFNVLDAFFAEEAAGAGRPRRLAFLFIDLEHFKEINDSFGHPAGDEILKQVGARLSRALEADDVVTRIGGDEFAVLLLDAGPEQAATVAARISEALREPFRLDAVHAQLGASIGIAIAPDDACDGATLMWCADVAMYRAKFGSTPHARYQRDTGDTDDHLRLAEELRAAVDAGELIVHYQPQLNLKTGTIGSVEALVRWPHPSLGLIPPLDFLGLAEDAGFMPRVTELVLAKALAQGAAWQRAGCEISVSVNIAASDLLRPGLAVTTAELLKQHGLAAERLVLEITETGIITDFERGKQVVGELQEMGVAVSIDDFGAGFTSLAYLSGLAVSELKLDRALIAQLAAGHTRRDLQLVRATVELGHALGLRVVAEGIDSQQTLDLVTELGCDMAQGYFIGTPKPANKLSFRQAAEANGHPAARSAPKRLLPSA